MDSEKKPLEGMSVEDYLIENQPDPVKAEPLDMAHVESRQQDIEIMKNIMAGMEDESVPMPVVVPDMSEAEIVSINLINDMKSVMKSLGSIASEPVYKRIIGRLQQNNVPYYANSNISAYIKETERAEWLDEVTDAFKHVLDTLIIDQENDPNSMGTARRLAKMYVNEIMSGRYEPMPNITAFPNQHTGKTSGFGGLLVVRSELKSICSHHHQPVTLTAYIGIIPENDVIGLSKYTRLAQWLARRGTLQEELAEDIAQGIMAVSGAKSVAVYLQGTHGCCENRGVMASDSTTQTTVLHGDFMSDSTVRKEFHDNILLQETRARK